MHPIAYIKHLAAACTRWLFTRCTPAGRRALRKRERERELRSAGVPRDVARLAAGAMVDATAQPVHRKPPRRRHRRGGDK